MRIGSHVQMKAPDFLEGSVREALSYGANALMLYTGAPQNTRRRPVEDLHIKEAQALMRDNGIRQEDMIVHAPYIINPANSTKEYVAELAREFLQSEVDRVQAIGATYMVLHPGAFTDSTLEDGIATVISQLNGIDFKDSRVVICLETMAGKGTEVGRTFEELEAILQGVRQKEHFGVCLDTCHIHDAGYALADFDSILDTFDHILGLSSLHVIHLNDSKNVQGSHKDRHANIGGGEIGFDILNHIAHNPRTENIVKILETPYIDKKPPYRQEIAMLKEGVYHPEWLADL